jgi:outer membrane protein OmpA-like peptidoglycan-associated protein
MRSSLLFVSAAAVATALISSYPAHAQTKGFTLDQFDPSERGSDWFAADSLDLRGHLRPAIGIVGDYADRPLAIYNPDGSYRTSIVSDQFFVHLGASLVLWERLRLSFNLPLAVTQAGDNPSINGTTFASPSSFAVGDLRLSADLRLLGTFGDPITVAIGGAVYLPTGSQSDYTGDQNVRVEPHVMAAGDLGPFVYAAKVGFEYHGLSESFAGTPIGNQFNFAASAGIRVANKKLVIGPEVFGSTTVRGGEAFDKTTTPLEGLVGFHYLIANRIRVGLGAGAGLDRGYGAPVARVLGNLEWAPGIEEKPVVHDRDGDGIVDEDDACPDVPGIRTDDPKTNGCPPPPPPPPPSDRDKDGILDTDDACPDVPGIKTDDPKTNGCPPPADRDKDGILDNDDACPDVPGVHTNDPKTNGCPPDPDRDKDGIKNEDDACPDEPGPANKDPKKNGCPQAVVRNNQIFILEQVKFATGSAVILPASNDLLNAVAKVFNDHPEIKKVSVEGHTDNVGPAGYNKILSARRAASVVAWLVKHGIDKGRLASAGFGMERPLEPNSTPAGRQANRRVEFHIVDPAPQQQHP